MGKRGWRLAIAGEVGIGAEYNNKKREARDLRETGNKGQRMAYNEWSGSLIDPVGNNQALFFTGSLILLVQGRCLSSMALELQGRWNPGSQLSVDYWV